MTSLAELPKLVGFFSYSREDDEDFRGELSAIRAAIGRHLAALLGRSKRQNFRLWQDVEAIAPGKMWETEIAKAIEESVFFIPIVTPRAVQSPYCKSEFESFLARERALGRNDLVFPIVYIPVPALGDEAKRRSDRVLTIVAERQFIDWRSFRYHDVNATAFRQEIGRFCEKIAEALRETWISPEERRQLQDEARRRAEEEDRIRQEAEAQRKAEERERLRKEAEAKKRAEDIEDWVRREFTPSGPKGSPLRVFLCHASEDKETVRSLYQELKQQGFAPWLDEEDLIPGQVWDTEITIAIRQSDAVLVCLSPRSGKRGYVQKEIARALDVAEEQREGTIFLIPVRLEDCDVPDRLKKWQWVNLYEQSGRAKLQRALETAARKLPQGPVIAAAPGRALANVSPLTAEQERALKPGDSFKEGVDCPEMIVVPAGRFLMGSPKRQGDGSERPQHEVMIASPFAVAKFAVTFDEWDACAASGGCRRDVSDNGWGRGRRPAINGSWDDAQAYVKWLSRITGKPYRLLSEAEYEYAARAGSRTTYPWGREIKLDGKPMANCDGCGSQWDHKQTAPVGSFPANAFGLYDMIGNVWGWTEDCWTPNYQGAPADGSAWTSGDCTTRVVRGGSWLNAPDYLRSAHRTGFYIANRYDDLGFRVARTLTP